MAGLDPAIHAAGLAQQRAARAVGRSRVRLNCPNCGTRGLEEFTYAGDATLSRPGANAEQSAWVDYVYFRDNPAGPHSELWYHAAACRQFLTVERDTRTHEILSAAIK